MFSFFQSLKDPSAVSIGPPVSQLCMSPPFLFCIFIVSDFSIFDFFFAILYFQSLKDPSAVCIGPPSDSLQPSLPRELQTQQENVLDNIKDIKSLEGKTYLGVKITYPFFTF